MEFNVVFKELSSGKIVYGVKDVCQNQVASSCPERQRYWLLSGECLRGPTSGGIFLTPRRAYQLLLEQNPSYRKREIKCQLDLFNHIETAENQ
ncbi:hypothetical protein [uncultured Pseudoteredinibacter sp.]|uniref:hypothetical protein n=1 Tax=uncultured Pseudoteredinibacter sp. TaxID=1641701 RepID=UPI002609CB4A|nr:hypothetical protein [uncultured Pseudoteredinibacter sp.]